MTDSKSTTLSTGILVLAHGTMNMRSTSGWEDNILAAIKNVRSAIDVPIEVSFGMWNTENNQSAIDKLDSTLKETNDELKRLIVVPIFVSDYSLVIEAQKYIFNLRESNPLRFEPDLQRVNYQGEVNLLSALNYDSVISSILKDRVVNLIDKAKTDGYSEEPSSMELIIPMHGPYGDYDNHQWMISGHKYAADLKDIGLREIHIISLRDDIVKDDSKGNIWERSRVFMRYMVEEASRSGRAALILPLLISNGGIEGGIKERLAGLNYVWLGEMLFPDQRLETYLINKINTNLGDS